MTIVYTIEAFNKSDEFIAFDIEVPKDNLDSLKSIMNWDTNEFDSFLYEGRVYDLTVDQVMLIEKALGKLFYSDLCDFQIGAWDKL